MLAQAAHQLGLRVGRRGLEGAIRDVEVCQRIEEGDLTPTLLRLEMRSDRTPASIRLEYRTVGQRLREKVGGRWESTGDDDFDAEYRVRAVDDVGLRWLTPHRRDALLAISDEVERLSISDGVVTAWYEGHPESGRDLAGTVYRLLAVVEPS